MAKKILGALAVVIVAFLGFAATRPSTATVERSAVIPASPEVVYGLIADFHQWEKWSPWDKLDPNQQRTFEGAAAGVGAIYSWAGNDKVGKGKMEIKDARTNEFVGIRLDFTAPWESLDNRNEFALTPEGTGTKVSWKMIGRQDGLMHKIMSLFFSMEKMVGPDFERGLASLKSAAESEATRRAEEAAKAAEAAAAEAAAAPVDADGGTPEVAPAVAPPAGK